MSGEANGPKVVSDTSLSVESADGDTRIIRRATNARARHPKPTGHGWSPQSRTRLSDRYQPRPTDQGPTDNRYAGAAAIPAKRFRHHHNPDGLNDTNQEPHE
jgi:hypothetical protein